MQRTSQRPTLFICHSTGGIVVKQALIRKPPAGESDIAALCLGVTFFATPHYGSSILSGPEYVKTVQKNLVLKWEMSQHLRHQFLLRNTDLKTLNYKFAVSIGGVKVISYIENMDTNLTVLSTNHTGVESLTTIRLFIVDSRSGKLSTPEVSLENEEIFQLNATHVGAPRFQGEDQLYRYYVEEIVAFVEGYSPEETAAYHALKNDIMTGVEIDVHQFYESTLGMKIISTHPCLQSFLELGPAKCMEDRLCGIDGPSDGPMIDIRRASEPAAPMLMVNTAETDEASDASGAELTSLLATTAAVPPRNRSTELPSMTMDSEDSASSGLLTPTPIEDVHCRGTPANDTGNTIQSERLQRRRLFPLPGPSSDRFKWIHVPFSNTGWVPHVLTTISQEKGDLSLHAKVLMDKMWISQHNRSLHASPHARFVRPSVRCLLPPNIEQSHRGGVPTPSSATGDTQIVVYLPYLHWDSFKNLQKREAVITRRRKQPQDLPIAKDVALGRSMERKVIWRHLTSNQPVHCRRTLDQYDNPNLRNTSYRDQNQTLYKRTKAGGYALPTKEPLFKNWSTARRQFVAANADIDADAGADANAAFIDETGKVLMVDQLWLWIMDNQTVVTFFASKEKEENDEGVWREGDVRSEIYQDINGDYPHQCVDPYDFAALVVFHAIKALPERAAALDLQVFRIYDEYISILTESQINGFRQFRDNQRFSITKDRSTLPYFTIEMSLMLCWTSVISMTNSKPLPN